MAPNYYVVGLYIAMNYILLVVEVGKSAEYTFHDFGAHVFGQALLASLFLVALKKA